MKRRGFLKLLMGGAAAGAFGPWRGDALGATELRRVRPPDAAWPGPEAWKALGRQLRGTLTRVESPFTSGNVPLSPDLLKLLENPYFVGDQAWATQSTGWAGAWTSSPSAYAVAAHTAEDVAAAVSFA